MSIIGPGKWKRFRQRYKILVGDSDDHDISILTEIASLSIALVLALVTKIHREQIDVLQKCQFDKPSLSENDNEHTDTQSDCSPYKKGQDLFLEFIGSHNSDSF